MSFEPPLQPGSRQTNLNRLSREVFDVLILGGGINGAGVARDLALRAHRANAPLKIALVEQNHFASGTSGKNSQLIHGGLRYLKYFEFRLVREALHERATLTEIAPHLVEPLPFLIPTYGHFARLFYGTGLWLYDMLAGAKNIGRHRRLGRADVGRLEPGLRLDDLVSGAIFFDCRVHSARFVLENTVEAAAHGAVIANYVQAGAPVRAEDGAWRVPLRDRLSGREFEARCRKVVNTVGPWAGSDDLRLVRGSHLILPRLNHSDYAIAYFEENGRIIFFIPWGSRQQLTLVGTTDVDHTTGPDEVRISAEEVAYLMRIVRQLFPEAAGVEPVSSYSSLRPLVRDDSDSPTSTSREHRIWNSPEGILHVAGGKYTTYRAMSEEAADLVVAELAPRLREVHLTASTPLNGNSRAAFESIVTRSAELAREHGIEEQQVRHIVQDYGVQTGAVLRHVRHDDAACLPACEAAQIAYAVRHEMASHLGDFLFVSTYLGYERRWDAEFLVPYAREMGNHLGWDADRQTEEIAAVLRATHTPREAAP